MDDMGCKSSSCVEGDLVNLLVGVKRTASQIMQLNIINSKLTILVSVGVGFICYSIVYRSTRK